MLVPHQERVVTEKNELEDKVTKLKAFFSNPIFTKLEVAEQDRLAKQFSHMKGYLSILEERIAAFTE